MFEIQVRAIPSRGSFVAGTGDGAHDDDMVRYVGTKKGSPFEMS